MKNSTRKITAMVLATSAAVMIAACQPIPDGVTNLAESSSFVADELGLNAGKQPISIEKALEVYNGVCVSKQSPSRFGLTENPASQTWTSSDYAVSLVRTSGMLECSFIFASREDALELITTLVTAGSALTSTGGEAEISINVSPYSDSNPFGESEGNGKYVYVGLASLLEGVPVYRATVEDIE